MEKRRRSPLPNGRGNLKRSRFGSESSRAGGDTFYDRAPHRTAHVNAENQDSGFGPSPGPSSGAGLSQNRGSGACAAGVRGSSRDRSGSGSGSRIGDSRAEDSRVGRSRVESRSDVGGRERRPESDGWWRGGRHPSVSARDGFNERDSYSNVGSDKAHSQAHSQGKSRGPFQNGSMKPEANDFNKPRTWEESPAKFPSQHTGSSRSQINPGGDSHVGKNDEQLQSRESGRKEQNYERKDGEGSLRPLAPVPAPSSRPPPHRLPYQPHQVAPHLPPHVPPHLPPRLSAHQPSIRAATLVPPQPNEPLDGRGVAEAVVGRGLSELELIAREAILRDRAAFGLQKDFTIQTHSTGSEEMEKDLSRTLNYMCNRTCIFSMR